MSRREPPADLGVLAFWVCYLLLVAAAGFWASHC